MNSRLLLCLSLLLVLITPITTHASWPVNGAAICTATGTQLGPVVVADGSGGMIMVWSDTRSGSYDIYAQKINAAGIVQWPNNGVPVRTGPGTQTIAAMIPDGAGGAIIAYNDNSFNAIYAQRIDASGNLLWSTPNGVLLCTVPGTQLVGGMVADGSGGAIISFFDDRAGTYNVFAQHVNAAGSVPWSLNGVTLCAAPQDQVPTGIVEDGNGGAIVCWDDHRNPGTQGIYAQLVDGAGNVQWAADGVLLMPATSGEQATLVTDGSGGAIAVTRSIATGIYAQRVKHNGVPQWINSGELVASTSSTDPTATVSDGAGGAIIAWEDYNVTTGFDIRVQLIDGSGNLVWTPGGVAVCTATGDQIFPVMIAPPAGGAIVAWADFRGATEHIYAQHIAFFGAPDWTHNGVNVASTSALVDEDNSISMALDGTGAGVLVAWPDYRNAPSRPDIYATFVNSEGSVATSVSGATPPASVSVSANYPNPFSSETSFDVTLKRDSAVRLEVFDVAGRRVREIDEGSVKSGMLRVDFKGVDDHQRALPAGIYFLRVHADAEWVTRKLVIEH